MNLSLDELDKNPALFFTHAVYIKAALTSFEDLKKTHEIFVKKNINFKPWNVRDSNGNNMLHYIINKNLEREFYFAIKLEDIDINDKNNSNETPLHYACKVGNLKIVKELINKNADLNILNDNNITPIIIASLKGYEEIVSFLLKKKAKLVIKTDRYEIDMFSQKYKSFPKHIKDLYSKYIEKQLKEEKKKDKKEKKEKERQSRGKKRYQEWIKICGENDLEKIKEYARSMGIHTENKTQEKICSDISSKIMLKRSKNWVFSSL